MRPASTKIIVLDLDLECLRQAKDPTLKARARQGFAEALKKV